MKLEFSLASTNMRLRVHHSVAPVCVCQLQTIIITIEARVTSYFVRSFVRRLRRRRSHFNYQSINSRGNYSGFHCGTYLISLSLNRSHAQQSPNIYACACFVFGSLFPFFLLEWLAFWHSPKNKNQTLSQTSIPIPHGDEESKDGTRRKQGKSQCHELTHRNYMRIKCCWLRVCFFSYVRTFISKQKPAEIIQKN